MRPRKRRREGKTDYKARTEMLKSGKPRVIFRKTNKYVMGQYVKSQEARDKVLVSLNSKELLKYGWPENLKGSLKSLPACYFTGFLLGKKIMEKEAMAEERKEKQENKEEKPEQKKTEVILDMGLLRSIKGSRVYSFLKGVVGAGINVKVKKEMFPDEKRVRGEKKSVAEIFNKIKENIERSFV